MSVLTHNFVTAMIRDPYLPLWLRVPFAGFVALFVTGPALAAVSHRVPSLALGSVVVLGALLLVELVVRAALRAEDRRSVNAPAARPEQH